MSALEAGHTVCAEHQGWTPNADIVLRGDDLVCSNCADRIDERGRMSDDGPDDVERAGEEARVMSGPYTTDVPEGGTKAIGLRDATGGLWRMWNANTREDAESLCKHLNDLHDLHERAETADLDKHAAIKNSRALGIELDRLRDRLAAVEAECSELRGTLDVEDRENAGQRERDPTREPATSAEVAAALNRAIEVVRWRHPQVSPYLLRHEFSGLAALASRAPTRPSAGLSAAIAAVRDHAMRSNGVPNEDGTGRSTLIPFLLLNRLGEELNKAERAPAEHDDALVAAARAAWLGWLRDADDLGTRMHALRDALPAEPEPTLLSCPMCGSADAPTLMDDSDEAANGQWIVTCRMSHLHASYSGCGASSRWGDTRAEAIAAWNRRAGSTPS